MDRVEEFFAHHRSDFQFIESPEGHEARFLARLQHHRRRGIAMQVMAAAAIALLTIALTSAVAWYAAPEWHKPLLSQISAPVEHLLFTAHINRRLSQVEQMAQHHPQLLANVQQMRSDFEAERLSLYRQALTNQHYNARKELVAGQRVQLQKVEQIRFVLAKHERGNIK